MNMKIAVAGTGYVGLSLATLLAQHNEVKAVDIIPEKVELINNKNPRFRTIILKNIWLKRTSTLLLHWMQKWPIRTQNLLLSLHRPTTTAKRTFSTPAL